MHGLCWTLRETLVIRDTRERGVGTVDEHDHVRGVLQGKPSAVAVHDNAERLALDGLVGGADVCLWGLLHAWVVHVNLRDTASQQTQEKKE
jgi:hypothetical protein